MEADKVEDQLIELRCAVLDLMDIILRRVDLQQDDLIIFHDINIAAHRFDMNGGPIGWGRSPYKYM